jgi:DNA-binding NarL/FixJ family response regulator
MNSTNKIKPDVIIVDDHLIFRQGLKALLTSKNIATVIGEASNGKEYLDLLTHLNPDLVLMDIDMPHMNGMEATEKSMALFPDLKIITFTMFGDEVYYYKMVNLGVKGFILKSSGIEELKKAVIEVMNGESYFSNELLRKIITNLNRNEPSKNTVDSNLTTREIDILKHICQGLNNEEIASKLFISPKTVKRHRANLFEKTNCKNAYGLIHFAIKNKIIEF